MLRQPLTIIVLLALAFGLAFAFLAVRGRIASPDTSGGAIPGRARSAREAQVAMRIPLLYNFGLGDLSLKGGMLQR